MDMLDWDQVDWDGKAFGDLRVDWHYDEIYPLIHQLQPHALIGNNHHLAPIEGEDFQMFEKDLPGVNTTGWATSAEDIGNLPLEVCQTINSSWGFNLQDDKHKTTKELIQLLVQSAGYGSNLLLNVGPMPNGKIQEIHSERIREVGQWLEKYGQTIYGTRKGPTIPNEDYVSTRKENIIYIHVLNPEINILRIEDKVPELKSVVYFDTNEPLPHQNNESGLSIDLSHQNLDEINSVIVLELQ